MSRKRKEIKKEISVVERVVTIVLFCFWFFLFVFGYTAWKYPDWYEGIINPGKTSEMTDKKDRADNLLRGNNFYAAIEAYQTILSIDPQNEGAMVNMGIAFYKIRRFPEAIDALKYSLTLDPELIDVIYHNLGDSYSAMGQIDSAAKYYQMAAETSPFPIFSWSRLAVIYRDNQMWEKATFAYENALDNKLNMYNSYLGMLKRDRYRYIDQPFVEPFIDSILISGVDSTSLKEKYDQEIFEKIVSSEQDLSMMHNDLGAIYATIGSFELAKRNFELAYKINPQNVQAKMNIELINNESNNSFPNP